MRKYRARSPARQDRGEVQKKITSASLSAESRIEWSDAVQRVFERCKSLKVAVLQLAPLLRSGDIQTSVVTAARGELQCHPLPTEFWRQTDLQSAYGLQHKFGSWLKKNPENPFGGGWPNGLHRFFLKKNDLDQHFPEIVETAAVEMVKNDRRKSGPKIKDDWKDWTDGQLICIVHFEGVPENVAALKSAAKEQIPWLEAELPRNAKAYCEKVDNG